MKDLNLKEFEANSFMGINSEDPVVITFPKKNGIVLLKGNQGTRKTSTLTALMHLMGAAFGFDTKNLYNNEDETIDVNLTFEYNGVEHVATQSGSRLTLKKFYKEADKFIQESSPKETLRNIFGNLGVSPMFLKNLDGKKQIQWFKDTFGNDEEATRKEVKLKKDLTTAMSSRKDANRDKKNLAGWLAESKLAQNYEKNLKNFSTPVTIEKEQEKYNAAMAKKREYDDNDARIKNTEATIATREQQIAEMEAKLVEARKVLQDAKDGVERGKAWMEENKKAPKEFETAQVDFMNASKKIEEYRDWKEVVRKKKELDAFEEASTLLTGQIDNLRIEMRKLVKKYLPDIEGLEIKIATGIDDEIEEDGIFYNGRSLAQLSESELWDLFLLIWEQKDVQFIFCENINSLGSDAINTLNRLAKEKKAQIFASEVDRKKNTMEISFTAKVV